MSNPSTPQPPTNAEQNAAPPREPWGWARRQRITLGILVGILAAVLIIDAVRRPARLGDPPAIVEGAPLTLPQRMDPNTATKEDLARVPHVGEALAGRIIDYREARKATAADGIVFRQLDDLDPVPGVGKKLLEQLKDYLEFPEESAATQQ